MTQRPGFIARSLDLSAERLSDPARLGSIDRHGLAAAQRDVVFDRASALASKLLAAPISLVSIVTDEAQHLVGATGLDAELDEQRTTPLSHSFCQHVVTGDAAFVVDDAANHPTVADNLAIPDLGVAAYLGVPLRDADGLVLGSLCVIATEERAWTSEELQTLEQLGEFVRSELLLRDHLDQIERAHQGREDLIKTVAHDLRAAVTAISGALQTVEARPGIAPEAREQLLRIAVHQSGRMRELMDALLDPPRSAGLRPGPVELAELTHQAVSAAASALGGSARLELDLDPTHISTHAPSLERVLINLVRNALQHTDGKVRVACERDRDHAMITIADEGPGLPEWLLTGDLGDASLRGRATGHGIGLFSAVTLLRALGGELSIDTGHTGTVLVVAIPVGKPPAARRTA